MGKLDKNIIAKYLAGECSESEIIQVRNWISSSSGNKELFLDDQKVWNEVEKISSKFASINLEKELEVYMNQIQTISSPEEADLKSDSYFYSKNKRISFRPWLKYAAIFLIIINIVGIIGYLVIKKIPVQNLYSEISVPNGSVSKFVLPDGTHVWLNAGSKLRYVKNFDQKVREVFLEGEGYFVVAKDPKRPFVVEASNLTIRDIGTEFDVQCYPSERKIEATLVKGLIKVTKANGKRQTDVMLKPNQKLTFIKNTGALYVAKSLKKISKKVSVEPSTVNPEIKKEREEQMIVKTIDPNPVVAWKDEKLLLTGERFEEVKGKLERWYNVKITVTDPEIMDYRFKGSFEKESVVQALDALKLASPFHYKINNNNITISK